VISTIAIPTKDRPALLRRAAKAYIANAKKYERDVELLVVDGSTNPAKRNANKEGLCKVSHETGFTKIRYISTREVQPFVRALAREGVDPEVAEFALADPLGTGFTAGAARNVALLETLGGQILMVDDDTLPEAAVADGFRTAHFRRPVEPAFADDPLDLDPTEFKFFDDRATALERANLRKGINVLKLFENPLGRVPTDLKHEYAEKDHVVRGDLRAGRVWISQAGVLGDAGFSWSAYPLLKGGLTMANLRSQVKLSRAVMRVPVGACVQAAAFCYTHAMGLDNTQPLPPFLPVHVANGRGGENLYGSIMKAWVSTVVVAFIPFALAHDPPDDLKWTKASLSWGVDIRLHDVFAEALNGAQRGPTRAGAHLRALAQDGFQDWLRASMAVRGAKLAETITRLKDAYRPRDVPNGWHTAIDLILDLYEERSKGDNYAIPKDLNGEPQEVVELTRKIVGNFGKLLDSWQDLRDKTKQLRKSHSIRMSLAL
jgi:hypothetical protein